MRIRPMTTTVVITMDDHLPGPEAMACMVGTLPHHVDNDVLRYYGHRVVSFGRAGASLHGVRTLPTKTTPTMNAASVGRRALAEMARTTQASQLGDGIGSNKK